MDDYDFSSPIDYSIGTPTDFGSSFTPESIYDLYDGNHSIGSYSPDMNASSEDWLNYFQDQSGTNGWDINTSSPTSSNNTQIGKLLASLGLSDGTASTLGTLGSLGLIGTNLYQDYQTNELQQEKLRQDAIAAATNMKIGDASIYRGFTDEAGQQTTSARDNMLLRQYMDQTQPYNRERELAILGSGGVDVSKMMAMRDLQEAGRASYVNDLLGYENKFNNYASDLTSMRNQDQMYNMLKPNQGALNTMAVSQPPQQSQFDWMSTVPAGADPAQVAAYQQFLAQSQG